MCVYSLQREKKNRKGGRWRERAFCLKHGVLVPHRGKPANGEHHHRSREPRDRSRSPIDMERLPGPSVSMMGGHLYTHIMPSLNLEQPLALTKSSNMALSPSLSPVERQQNRPSVITCAPANNRNCNLSHCTGSHNGCSPGLSASYRRAANCEYGVTIRSDSTLRSCLASHTLPCLSANTACDPMIDEHFRRSLGKSYKEPEPVANSVSITGSVDDHFAKALGETWLQIKAKGGSPGSPDHSPTHHMVNHSPSLVS
ncbi:hypothetical protein DNTS_023039 [Danionella cerebrum]|uniref:Transcription cofactor vestigial-like protein 4 n=1 Tax=Danionella cerebrum TaxID=2873325 RepID=A0A553Q574_9TELE|nr:hypothetical protein DNTS_023039 [Danionella translucida]